MQLRGSTQRKCPEKTYGNESCDNGASAVIRTCKRAHRAATLLRARVLRKKFLQDRRDPRSCWERQDSTQEVLLVAGFSAKAQHANGVCVG